MLKTLGGERLGSGNKMKVAMHNYERSTHNMGNAWRSSMAPGLLVPFYKKLCQNGDTWTIDLNALVRTVPAIGPLFGSYKLQMDVFEIPIRLYNGVLHNNWTKIGMDMSKVKLPKVGLGTVVQDGVSYMNWSESQISTSSLTGYLGIRGIGGTINQSVQSQYIWRKFNAVPFLAYWDIFKNYYANKQEKNAYVIQNWTTTSQMAKVKKITWIGRYNSPNIDFTEAGPTSAPEPVRNNSVMIIGAAIPAVAPGATITLQIEFDGTINLDTNHLPFIGTKQTGGAVGEVILSSLNWSINNNILTVEYPNFNGVEIESITKIGFDSVVTESAEPRIKEFDLENIDTMRKSVLWDTGLNNEFNIAAPNLYPYKTIYEESVNNNCMSKYPLQGLALKTYQSDYFNCWLSREWIDGVQGISNITAVSTANNEFTIDALNLAMKVYNMLNRIAISGGTYQDWQEAVYGEDAVRMAESPIFCGGMSCMIAFEEVVSTADTNTATAGDMPLGSLAGKGTIVPNSFKGGNIDIHIKEPAYIMGIVSITPIIDYYQGNDFDMTELDSLNDIHKPALDGIGFQNLMLESAAWWGKEYDVANTKWVNNAVAKHPAWIHYMTSWNEVHGDFADKNKAGFMVLTRDYEHGLGYVNGTNQTIPVKDFTTYINPSKYNYQFANTGLDSQNFWVQIAINATVRRKISAKVIPNL